MAGIDGIGSQATGTVPPSVRDATVGGQSFRIAAGGAPRFDEFQGKGGAYQAAWDDVAGRLGTQDSGRVAAQMEWDYQMRQAPAADAAGWLVQRDTGVIATEASTIDYVDTARLANDMTALRSIDSARAQAIDGALSARLPAADYGRFHEDLRTAQAWPGTADAKLRSAADTPGRLDAKAVDADAGRLLHQATSSSSLAAWLGGPRNHLSTTELAFGVQKLAETNPAQATAVRAALTERLGAQDAGDLNRILAGDTHFGEGIGTAFSHPGEAIVGAAKGLAGFATNVGDLFVRGAMMESAGEQRQQGGIVALTGNAPLADAMVSTADGVQQAAQQRQLPVIEPGNIAQRGGADIETGVEVGVGVAGAVRGGAKLAMRGAAAELEAGGAGTLAEAAHGSQAVEAAGKTIELTKGRFGHTFSTHGQNQTEFLTHRAAGSGAPQGQFLDDQAAARLIVDNLDKVGNGAVSVPLPEDFPARVIMPDGSYAPATSVRLVPSGHGVKTAYPEL